MIVLDLEVIPELGNPEKIGDPKALEIRNEQPQSTTIGGAGFYGVKSEPVQESKAQVQKQLASTSNRGGGGGGPSQHGGSTIYPIEALSPYANKWTIKVRVTSKSDIRRWSKTNGDGKLFSVNLLDESGEIRATGFNEQVDQFYDLFQEGNVYYISTPCKVGLAKKQFSNLPNDYELVLERDTVIEKAEDESSVPQVRFNFCSIQELQEVEKDATVDVIGVLTKVSDVDEIISKTTQKGYNKRELTLADDTGYEVRVTVWGKTATEFDANPESIVAFKGTRVSDFNGRSLSLLSSGTMAIDPDIPEAHKLKGWYDSNGRNQSFATHSNMSTLGAATGRKDEVKTIGQVKAENIGVDDVAYFNIKATVVYIKQENFAYPACPIEGCAKKVTETSEGWRCEKHNVDHEKPQYRYIMSISATDHTGNLLLSCFDDSARVIMGGKTADELMEMQAIGDKEAVDKAFEAANCRKWAFRCRAKMETYSDQPRYVVEGNAMSYWL
jgi:replication factor A1